MKVHGWRERHLGGAEGGKPTNGRYLSEGSSPTGFSPHTTGGQKSHEEGTGKRRVLQGDQWPTVVTMVRS